jgi:hypothetical protein
MLKSNPVLYWAKYLPELYLTDIPPNALQAKILSLFADFQNPPASDMFG